MPLAAVLLSALLAMAPWQGCRSASRTVSAPKTVQPSVPSTLAPPRRQFSVPAQLRMPGADGKLHPIPYRTPRELLGKVDEMHRRHLQAVVQASPGLFPKGTRVLSVNAQTSDPNLITVNLNAALADKHFWKSRKQARLAVYSLVDNIADMNVPKGCLLPVRILVEGRRVKAIGGFPIGKPLKFDGSLLAKQ